MRTGLCVFLALVGVVLLVAGAAAADSSDSASLTITGSVVSGAVPIADFSPSTTSGPPPLTVQFTDLSTNNPTEWLWDFDSDETIDSTDQHPAWTYTDPGTYTVTLMVINGVGQDTLVREDYITVSGKDAGERIDDLMGHVKELKIPPGIKNVLGSELSLARWAYYEGNPDWCAYYMQLFIRTVTLLRGNAIPAADADSLIEEALDIILLLQ